MSTAANVSAAPAGDPEAAYYQTIEEFFVSRRGDPLFLSNADWLLIRGWRKSGTPLRVVLRGIADALDSHAHSWGRHRKVGSLAYCAAEVDVARDRWQRALALGEDPLGSAPDAVLTGFADALDVAPLTGDARADASSLAVSLREWSVRTPALRELEATLAAREAALLARLRDLLPTEALTAIENAADAELAPYAARMPAKVLEQIRRDSITRRVLGRFGIPRLSLFGL
jgi:hypothetical protein